MLPTTLNILLPYYTLRTIVPDQGKQFISYGVGLKVMPKAASLRLQHISIYNAECPKCGHIIVTAKMYNDWVHCVKCRTAVKIALEGGIAETS